MSNDYTSALSTTMKNEGSTVDTSGVGNRGNSLYGITQKTWNEYTKKLGIPSSRVEELKPEQAAIFYKDYFSGTGIENLPPDIYKQVFDYGVQSGPKTAVKALQKIVGASPDGQIGPQTLDAISKYSQNTSRTANDLLNQRRTFLEELAKKNPLTHGKNLKGYLNRIEEMRSQIK